MSLTPANILRFWFAPGMTPKWYEKNADFDDEIRMRFLNVFEEALHGAHDGWAATPEGRLALIVLLDQFPRNMFRGSPRSFSGDGKARVLTKEGLARCDDAALEGDKKAFFYLPLMHSEDLEDQQLCVGLFEKAGLGDNLHYAVLHRDIIARFGRFPHRNAVLGRVTTKDEAAFLQTPNSSF